MTTTQEVRSTPRWLLAAGLCAALLAQMALPALHALAIAQPAPHATHVAQIATNGSVVALAAQVAPAHDSATCPICQSLTRTKPVAVTPVSPEEPARECARTPLAAPACGRFAVSQSGHRPRAPPAHAIHLG